MSNGLFTKILGEKNTLPVSEFDQELWLEIDVEGMQDDREKVIPFARIAEGDVKPIKFKFRYFQSFKGEIRIPEGFEPQRIRIRLKPRGKGQPPAIEETMEWQA